MKIMHIITRLVRGGAQRVAIDLCRGLKAAGHEVVLVSGEQTGTEGSLWAEAESLGIDLMRVKPLVREMSPLKDWAALGSLRAIIHAHRPDVVHCHTSKAGLLGCLAARKERVRAVVFAPHGHPFGTGAAIPGVPQGGLRRRMIEYGYRKAGRCADAVISPNQHEQDEALALGLWSAAKAVVVPNGIDTDKFVPADKEQARRRHGLDSSGVLIGVVARLTREKGVDVAIEMLPRLPEVMLVVVGDGPEKPGLLELAGKLGVAQRVRWLGMREDVASLLPAFDVVVAPSRTEAHGLAVAEAMSCEVPVVASGVGGLKALVMDGQTGAAVAAGDACALDASLSRLLESPDMAKDLAKAGRAHIVANFSLATMLHRTQGLYDALVQGRDIHA